MRLLPVVLFLSFCAPLMARKPMSVGLGNGAQIVDDGHGRRMIGLPAPAGQPRDLVALINQAQDSLSFWCAVSNGSYVGVESPTPGIMPAQKEAEWSPKALSMPNLDLASEGPVVAKKKHGNFMGQFLRKLFGSKKNKALPAWFSVH